MVDYIYTILYKYITLNLVLGGSAIVLIILVLWTFWGATAARNRVVSLLGGNKLKDK